MTSPEAVQGELSGCFGESNGKAVPQNSDSSTSLGCEDAIQPQGFSADFSRTTGGNGWILEQMGQLDDDTAAFDYIADGGEDADLSIDGEDCDVGCDDEDLI